VRQDAVAISDGRRVAQRRRVVEIALVVAGAESRREVLDPAAGLEVPLKADGEGRYQRAERRRLSFAQTELRAHLPNRPSASCV
jgi:hypothetical protein